VLANVSPIDLFSVSRGLRQGDPISTSAPVHSSYGGIEWNVSIAS